MPEPVKYLYRVISSDGMNTVLVENIDGRVVLETLPLVTTEQAEAYAQARVLESRPTYFGDGYQSGWNSALEEAAEIADQHNNFSTFDAIRALKERA